MNCDEMQDLMAVHSMHELSDPMRTTLACHIASCTVCADMFEDILAMADIWEDGCEHAEGLDLVTPVMAQIQTRPPYAQQAQRNDVCRKPARKLIKLRTTFYHYGLAASFSLILLHFGVFNHMGSSFIHTSAMISGKVQGLFALTRYL